MADMQVMKTRSCTCPKSKPRGKSDKGRKSQKVRRAGAINN